MADYVEQRVTNAVILGKLESMDKEWRGRFDGFEKRLETAEGKIDQVRIAAAPCSNRFEGVERNIDELEKKVNGWSAINSVGALFAMIIGFFIK